jgi:hypothetical protein
VSRKQQNIGNLAQWQQIGDQERLKIAKSKGLLDKNGNLTRDGIVALFPGPLELNLLHPEAKLLEGTAGTVGQLRQLVPLPGDTMRYALDKNKQPRLALDKNGDLSFPRVTGRHHPHMSKIQQAIKSASLAIFRKLFTEHAKTLVHAAVDNGTVCNGVPVDDFPAIAARATVMATRQVKSERFLRATKRRNVQMESRRINRAR